MLHGLRTTFTFDNFKELLKNEDYDSLIYNCYYCFNQEEILGYLDRHLNLNNFIINYVYIRNNYQLGKFSDPDILRKCLSLALKTIFIVLAHINICIEINRNFDILSIIVRKFDEKFKDIVKNDILHFAINNSKKEILCLIDTMSGNIALADSNLPGTDKRKMLDLPEPYLICNTVAGAWRYPALKYEKVAADVDKANNERFIKNYSARCQKYYEAYQFFGEKLNLCKTYFMENEVFDLIKIFL